jgi:hypothetical protein
MEWISVNDRLPEIGSECLVCDISDESCNPDSIEIARYFIHGDILGFYWWDKQWCDSILAEVSHWMPLPQLPK